MPCGLLCPRTPHRQRRGRRILGSWTSDLRRSKKKFSNYSEPGCREGSFVGPALLCLTLRRVLLSAFRRMALVTLAASDTLSYAVGLRPFLTNGPNLALFGVSGCLRQRVSRR